MEPQVLHAICERVRQSLYIRDSIILKKNHRIEKMHFFVEGGGVEIEVNGIFREMDIQFCGEELLIWCLEKESQQLSMYLSMYKC
jgi:cyclic nucleotide gated channel